MAKNFDIPSLSSKVDPEVRRAFNAIKARVESLGAVVTDEELTGTRAFMRKSDGKLIANIQTLDTTTPPPVTGLIATSALNSVLLQWTPPQFMSLARVEIWRSTSDDLDTAGMVGTTGSTGFLDMPGDAVSPTTPFYYWVRIISSAEVVGPFNAVAGTVGHVSDTADYLLEVLTGEISEAELTPTLNDRIDIIDEPVTGLTARMDAAEAHAADTANPHVTTLDQVSEQGADSSRLFSCNSKVALTPEGGVAVRLTNKTGAASVKGTVVTTGTVLDNSFAVQTAEFEAAGIVYEAGIADGAECWVVVSGIAEVLMKDGIAPIRGDWCKCADTDGRAEATVPPTGIGALATSEHFKEIGHCLESKTAGTDVLAKVVLHFN